jgi:hypothetical protein
MGPSLLQCGKGLMAAILLSLLATSCRGRCGFGLHDRIVVASPPLEKVSCCGGFVTKDLALTAAAGDAAFDLSNVATDVQLVDAFLVPTSCAKLFDMPYPGGSALCSVYTGPVTPGHLSSRVTLATGTYRVWLQGYSSNTAPASFTVDVGIWDYSCRTPITGS